MQENIELVRRGHDAFRDFGEESWRLSPLLSDDARSFRRLRMGAAGGLL